MNLRIYIFFILLLHVPHTATAYILGAQNQLNALALQGDGKIIGAGFTVIDKTQKFLISRYTSDGLLDATFGTNGVQTTVIGDSSVAYAMGLDSSNNIIVAGSTVISGVSYFAIAKYLPNGNLDSSFGTNGIVLTSLESGCSCYAMLIEPDDKFIITGALLKDGEVWIPLVRYNTDGTIDTTFGDNGVLTVEIEDCAIAYSLVKQSDGKYIMAGFAEGQSFVVRANSDGTLDTSFGDGGAVVLQVGFSSSLKGVDLQSSDKIILVGYSEGQCLIARLDIDGSLDLSFGDSGIVLNQFGVYNAFLDLAIDSEDRIHVVGLSDDTAILSRYTAEGVLDTTFGNYGVTSVICGYIGNINAIKIQSDNKILGTGFSDNNALVVRVNTNGQIDTSFGANGLVLDPTDYFPTCVEDSAGSTSAYVFAYDTTNQTVSVSNSFQDVTFNTNSQLLNWAHSSGTATFTCNKTGVYEITYTIASEKTSGSGLMSGSLRLIKNGTEIPGSQQVIEYATNNQTMVQSKTLIATFTQGDVLKLQYAGSSTNCRLIAGDGIGSVRPSAAISVAQLS